LIANEIEAAVIGAGEALSSGGRVQLT
jgi:hypothetical protein